jgi:hypothetical protein
MRHTHKYTNRGEQKSSSHRRVPHSFQHLGCCEKKVRMRFFFFVLPVTGKESLVPCITFTASLLTASSGCSLLSLTVADAELLGINKLEGKKYTSGNRTAVTLCIRYGAWCLLHRIH